MLCLKSKGYSTPVKLEHVRRKSLLSEVVVGGVHGVIVLQQVGVHCGHTHEDGNGILLSLHNPHTNTLFPALRINGGVGIQGCPAIGDGFIEGIDCCNWRSEQSAEH